MANKKVFSIHYDKDGNALDVTVEPGYKKTEGQALPERTKIERVANTPIFVGDHNPHCRYIWIPGRGWVWVCNNR